VDVNCVETFAQQKRLALNRIRHALTWTILVAVRAFGQDTPKHIGAIEFFGYSGIDLTRVRAVLPFQEGDEFDLDKGEGAVNQAQEAVRRVTGHAATDVSPTCCDRQNNWILFIGLSGKTLCYNPPPKGAARLPGTIISLYDLMTDTLLEAVQRAATEDHSKGYALSEYQPLRSKQLEMRAYATNHARLLRDVVKTSSDDQQRIAAAHLLGYTRQSKSQIAALVHASRDTNGNVRNNATRALIVLVESNPKIATHIPVGWYADLLLSGTSSDLNKASFLLASVTKNSSANMLEPLRNREVVERLMEMARWRTHGEAAKLILSEMTRMNEERLAQLVKEGNVEQIIEGKKLK